MDEIKPATPAEQPNGGTPPPAPAATPGSKTPETVSLTKEVHDQLLRDAARGSTNQRKADLYDRTVGGKGNTKHFSPKAPEAAPTQEELAAAGADEDRKAERGILQIAVDPVYREIFDKDPTLRDLFTKNPMAVLPMFAADALDAEDAMTLVKEELGKRKPAPASAPIPDPAPNPTPPPGGVNINSQPVNEEVEAAKKLSNTEDAISGMIKARIKAGKK